MHPTSPRGAGEQRTAVPLVIWALLIGVLLSITAAYIAREIYAPQVAARAALPPDPRLPLPAFSLIESSGAALSLADLRGRVWIADFIFTACAGPCPLMSRKMRQLQEDLADLEDLRLVSFSVDPGRDTPEVLRGYGQRYGANPGRWLFLTGDMDRIYDLAIKGFRIAVEEARQNNQIIHDTRFMLVDRQGRIRGYFDSNNAGALEALRIRTRDLCRSNG